MEAVSVLPTAPSRTPLLWAPLGCMLLLMLATFSAPGRVGPDSAGELDVIALLKLAVRFGTLGVLGVVLLRSLSRSRSGLVLQSLFPFGLFIAWSILSVGWSALPSVSLGQVSGLLVQVLLAATLGILCDEPAARSQVIKFLSFCLLTMSTILLGAALLFGLEFAGLDRTISPVEGGTVGIVHPTSAGATAGLGLLVLIAAALICRWNWAFRWLWIGVPVHGALLLLANSRTSAGVTLALVVVVIACFGYRAWLALAVFIGCTIGALYLAADPGLSMAGQLLGTTASYAARGESVESFTSLTGRTDLWEAILVEFRKSMLWGHGYFVTSEHGLLDVWSGPENRSAHNVFLQVLVTTGLIGAALFLWALGLPLFRLLASLRQDAEARGFAPFLLILALWYLGWGQMCESFMGPIQPESVVFFTCFGLALGMIRPVELPTFENSPAGLIGQETLG